MKPYQPALVTTKNTKTQKGEARGYLTGIMHLAPADLSGYGNVCPSASPECRAHCLNTAGTWVNSDQVKDSRIQKTKEYFTDRPKFIAGLRKSIEKIIREAERKDLIPCIRINGTSDLPGLARQMAKEYPEVQFFDYTKLKNPWKRTSPNYHITFSRSEINDQEAMETLKHGVNVAVVFDIKKGSPLPEKWRGYYVIDGDMHDLRFLDDLERPDPNQALVIGLRAKGKARGKGSDSGFVMKIHPAEQPKEQPTTASAKDKPPHVEYFQDEYFEAPDYD